MTSSPVRKMRLDVLRAAFAVAHSTTDMSKPTIILDAEVFHRLVAAVDAWRRLGAHPVPPPKQE
jgi:hypothetical protein